MKKICFCSLFLTLSILSLAQPLWMRYNVISPQGDKIAFTYKGDIYVVDVDGGLARQITTSTAYDYYPVWSNDGKNIAFASDRYGNFDVFIVSSKDGIIFISFFFSKTSLVCFWIFSLSDLFCSRREETMPENDFFRSLSSSNTRFTVSILSIGKNGRS